MHVVTLASNFRTPLLREWCLLNGLRSCSMAACLNLLHTPSSALVLVPGGASEALLCRNGSYDLVRLNAGNEWKSICEMLVQLHCHCTQLPALSGHCDIQVQSLTCADASMLARC